jgi:outer membrane protein OmpA-like peptidoglycan-associated protein
MEHVVSSRDWAINFDTGKATFTGNSIAQLNEMRDGALIADELLIKIQGHTDDTGSADLNRRLSQDRAEAVKRWLMAQGFPEERFVEVKGYGPDVPVADNSTAEGRAQNRRVVVILGS